MQISRYLTPKLVKLEMDTVFEPPEDGEAQILTIKRIQERKEALIAECVDLLNLSGKVGNKNKLLRDLFDRERASSGTAREANRSD